MWFMIPRDLDIQNHAVRGRKLSVYSKSGAREKKRNRVFTVIA